jgi:putative endonuclease
MNAGPGNGRRWERLAERFLRQRGLKTLQRNFHCRLGEIDLVMSDGPTLVFTEVRYRASDSHGSGAESVSATKQKRIILAAQKFIQIHHPHPAQICRFDVVSIGNRQGRTIINWIPNAFDAS